MHLYANKQQDDDNGNEAEALFFRKLVGHAIGLWANKQQVDDSGNEADAQFLRKLVWHALRTWFAWANKQQVDDNGNEADAQFWGTFGRLALKYLASPPCYQLCKR
jgi:hypothetical protein